VRAGSMTENRRVLIGGVGHPYLRDTSIGPTLVPVLKQMEWPDGVDIYDLHFGPIHVVQWLEEKPGYYDRVVLISGIKREREKGETYAYRWDRVLPDDREIHERICEAVTGIIGVDNLLIIGGHFGVWPDEVAVVEVEPCEEEFGAELSELVSRAVPAIIDLVRQLALGSPGSPGSLGSIQELSTDPFRALPRMEGVEA
jgi:hydrogenase maturation protease